MNSKQFAMIVGITFFVGMVWLISDIIFNTKASIPISPKLETSLEPVNPNFNSRVLDIIGTEVSETGVDIPISAPTASASPVASILPASIPSSSPLAATGGAELIQ